MPQWPLVLLLAMLMSFSRRSLGYVGRGLRNSRFIYNARAADQLRASANLEPSTSAAPDSVQSSSSFPSAPPLKVHIFVDGTWLYYSLVVGRQRDRSCALTARFGPNWRTERVFKWNTLPQIVAGEIARQLELTSASKRLVEVVRTSLYTSCLENTPIYGARAGMIEDWYRSNFEVHLLKTPPAVNNTTRVQEKCVDIMIAVDMLYMATVPEAYDVAVIITGDKDFIPALQKTRLKAKRVAIASVRNSCNKDLTRQDLHIRDFDLIWLEDHMDKLTAERPPSFALSAAAEKKLVDLVTECMSSAQGQPLSSRHLGRFLQTHQIEDESKTGFKTDALSLLKKGHFSIRAFLDRYSHSFKLILMPGESEFHIQQVDKNADAVTDSEDEDDGEDVYPSGAVFDDGLFSDGLTVAGIDPVEGREDGYDFEREGEAEEDEAETVPEEADSLRAEFSKLTVADIKKDLERRDAKPKRGANKAELVNQLVSLRLSTRRADKARLPRAYSFPSSNSKPAVRSSFPVPEQSSSDTRKSRDDVVFEELVSFLKANGPVNSRDLGRHLISQGYLDLIKNRHGSLLRYLRLSRRFGISNDPESPGRVFIIDLVQ